MSYYVVLNFEDANPGYVAGKKVKGFKGSDPAHSGGAAAGTLKVYHKRAEGLKSRDVRHFNKKKVVYFACQELLARDIAGTLNKKEINAIREECEKSKTIAFVIHGTPSDTEHGFSTDGRSLCTWGQLGRLGLLLLPGSSKTYNIALIMCYAARSSDAKVNHQAALTNNQLKDSFAYKFFRSLCVARSVRMSARTGAVSNDAGFNHTVEQEEQVLLAIQKSENRTDRTNNKAAMDLRKQQLIGTGRWTNDSFFTKMSEFVSNPNKVPANADEQLIRDYIPYSSQAFTFFSNQYQPDRLNPKSKYGKLVYEYAGGALTITNRYGSPDDPNVGTNHVLYTGPLL